MVTHAGDTLFSRARNLESELGFGRIWLKFEGSNPSGTQKDRIADAACADAHERGLSTVTLATCGNFGAAVARAAAAAGLRAVVFVPTQYHTPRVIEMERLGARVVRVPGDYEGAVAASRRAASDAGWYDANPGSDGQWDLSVRGYGRIAREIVDDLGRVPDTVSVAVGNGTTLAAVYAGFKEVIRERFDALPGHTERLEGASDSSRAPRMIAASTPRGNPVIKSWKAGLSVCSDLKPDEIRETIVNEPLVNWHAFDGQHALDALRESSGFAAYASDAEMKRATSLLRTLEGINVMTASTAAVVGLRKAHEALGDVIGDTHVIVLTGRHFVAPRASMRAVAAAPQLAPTPASYFVATPTFRTPEMVRHRS